MLKKFLIFLKFPFKRKLILFQSILFSYLIYFIYRFWPNLPKLKIDSTYRPGNFNPLLTYWIRNSIQISKKYHLFDLKCRHDAILAKWLLKKYRQPVQIYVGFKKNEQNKINGHAWVKSNQYFITGDCNQEEFVILN